jgi:hypothetical protein
MSQLDQQNLVAHTDAAIEPASETFLTLAIDLEPGIQTQCTAPRDR